MTISFRYDVTWRKWTPFKLLGVVNEFILGALALVTYLKQIKKSHMMKVSFFWFWITVYFIFYNDKWNLELKSNICLEQTEDTFFHSCNPTNPLFTANPNMTHYQGMPWKTKTKKIGTDFLTYDFCTLKNLYFLMEANIQIVDL